MPKMERYIELSDTIIDREKVSTVHVDPQIEGRYIVTMDNGKEHYFEGEDARILVAAFRGQSGPHVWKDKEEG